MTEYEYSDWGQAFCCVWVRSYTADAFEVACRDVGRPSSQPGPQDFPGSGNRTRCAVHVACPSCPDYSPEPPGTGSRGWRLGQEGIVQHCVGGPL